LKSNR
jgi:hypothetical protein